MNMKKFTLMAVAALMAGSALAQDVSFGIARPRVGTADSWVYDDFSYITTDDFVKDKETTGKDMNVKFYESDALRATVQKDEATESGYAAATNIRYHGSAVTVDYYWKIQCSSPNTSTHLHEGVKVDGAFTETTPNEDHTFGFDFTVPAGKELAVSKIFFNLLVEQNASTNIRILKGKEEVYNSGWSYAANGYNQHKTAEGQWVYGWCADITADSWTAYYGEDQSKLFSTQTVKDYMVSVGGGYKTLGDLKLAAGDYRIVISVDWNNENAKALSFDEFTIDGTLNTTEQSISDGECTFGIARPRVGTADSWVYDDFSYITTDDFVKDKETTGKDMNVKFYESDALRATVQKDEATESGYAAATNIRYHGSAVTVDYYWKIQCSSPNTSTHLHEGVKVDGAFTETTPNEDHTFGFDFTVPAGKELAVSKIFFNLLVEQNASTNIRILKGKEEVYNSGWSYAANGYNQHKTAEGQWVYGWCADITADSWTAYYGEDQSKLFSTQTVKDYMVSVGGGYKTLGDLKLAAGDYRIVISVDWNNENAKALSFDEFTVTGTLSTATGIAAIQQVEKKNDGILYNLSGQRIAQPVRGQIYIMNGKKYIGK